MKNIFEHTSSLWVKFSEYEIRENDNGTEYIIPSENAEMKAYSPMKDGEQLVIDTINLGLHLMRNKKEKNHNEIIEYVKKYGLLGIMTALPTTAEFITYENVYLPKNHLIKKEMLSTEEYLDYFYPFEKPDFVKRGVESSWCISNDAEGAAVAIVLSDRPQAVQMSLQRIYGEPLEWVKSMCTDIAFYFLGSFLYYHDYESLSKDQRDLYRQSMLAFDGVSPTYKIALLDKPTIIWDFNSLIQMVQMMFSFLLTDDDMSINMCKNCDRAYIPSRKGTEFCSTKCKNQYHVNKSRKKKDE